VIAAVAVWQEEMLRRRGEPFVHAADEFYLLTGAQPPADGAPEQYENGVGIAAALLAEAAVEAQGRGGSRSTAASAATAAEERGLPASVRGLVLLSGTLAAPVMEQAAHVLRRALAGTRSIGRQSDGARPESTAVAVRPLVVSNAVFGPHVTVTGLLGGREVLAALAREPLHSGEWLLAPRTWLPAQLGYTLDDIGEDELAAACGGRLILADSLSEALSRLESACRSVKLRG